jgi:TetR/AcrR family transcriptional regulator, transcriptional repressor for nem operon
LCGVLSADIASLPDKVRQAVQAFFRANENWLAKVLAEGEIQQTLNANGQSEATARALFAAFQGSLLASRLFQARARLDEVIQIVKR